MPANLKPVLEACDAADEAGDLELLNEIEAHIWLDGPGTSRGRVSGPARQLFLEMNGRALAHRELSEEQEPDAVYDQVANIAVPVMLISGQLDFPHVHEQHAYLEIHLQNATTCVIHNCAHLPPLEYPELVNERLLTFCQAL